MRRLPLLFLALAWVLVAPALRAQVPDSACLARARAATDSLAKLHVPSTVLTHYQVRSLRALDSLHAARCVTSAPVPPPDTVPPPPPPDTIPTPPPSSLPAWAQAVDRIVGPIPNCAQLAVATGPEREWYDAWRRWEPVRWKADSARWDAADYYDRSATYQAMAVCELPHDSTLSALYLQRGLALAVNYRDKYVIPNAGGVSAHWSQLEGVALHALVTGDSLSRVWVGRTAERLAASNYYLKGVVGDTTHIDYENRIGQRMLLAVLLAHELQVPGSSYTPARWGPLADSLLTLNLRAQRPSGAWSFRCLGGGACQVTFPYMDALWMDAMIRYTRLRRADPRIVPSVRATIDYHLAHAVRADSSWTYNLTPSTYGGNTASPDLNGLHPAAYAWLATQTGDASYLTRVAPLFLKGVRAGYYQGSKQFNQAFYSSFRYVAMRQAATAPTTP